MSELEYSPLGFGITCIDAAYVNPGTACFYLIEQGDECAVVETGTSHSVPLLMELLRIRGIDPQQVRYVIPTHVHLDHAGGAGAMMAVLPNAQLLIHPRGAQHMVDPGRLIAAAIAVYGEELFAALYGTIAPIEAASIRAMEDGETVSLAGRRLEFRHTRGHAEHHFCIWDESSRGWFSGDMFGVSYPWCRLPDADYVLPSTTPSQFDPTTYLDSLALLDSYAPERMYLTHYGELPYSAEKSQLLARQIAAYCVSAMVPLDVAALEQRLSDYSLQLLRQCGASGSDIEWRDRLMFDMQLNAQGLSVWRQRDMRR